MSDLKPCPFCGADKIDWFGDDELGYIECTNNECGIAFSTDSKHESTKAWNARPLESAKDARIAELEGMLKELYPAVRASYKSCSVENVPWVEFNKLLAKDGE